MDISRRGARRDKGRTDIVSGLTFTSGNDSSWGDNVRWSTNSKAIFINANWILHTDRKSVHNYTIKLTLADISALIELLGHAGAENDAALLRDHLQENIPAIVKLLACATGVQPLAIPDNDSIDSPKRGARKPPGKKISMRSTAS